jgi:hypothetical protein
MRQGPQKDTYKGSSLETAVAEREECSAIAKASFLHRSRLLLLHPITVARDSTIYCNENHRAQLTLHHIATFPLGDPTSIPVGENCTMVTKRHHSDFDYSQIHYYLVYS